MLSEDSYMMLGRQWQLKCEHLLCKNYSFAGFTCRLRKQQRFLLACQSEIAVFDSNFPLLFAPIRTMHDKVDLICLCRQQRYKSKRPASEHCFSDSQYCIHQYMRIYH